MIVETIPYMDNNKLVDLYKVTRAQIEHLDNILSQRIVWLVISQSFFVSGYSVLVTGNPNNPVYMHAQSVLLVLFPIVSIALIVLSLFDIICGLLYIKKLERFFDIDKDGSETPNYPPINGFKMLNGLKNASTLIVPFILIVFWLYILFI